MEPKPYKKITLQQISYFFQCSISGECINSSPAGKRRIAVEKQLSQLNDDNANIFNAEAALMDGSARHEHDKGIADQIKSFLYFAPIAAVAICSVFVIIFIVVVQVRMTDPKKNNFLYLTSLQAFLLFPDVWR